MASRVQDAPATAGLAIRTYRSHYCVSSNDPAKPKVTGPVSLQVN